MVKSNFLKNLLKYVKDKASNKWFKAVALSTVLFIIFWNLIPNSPDCLKIISFALFVIFYIIYIIKVALKEPENILFTKAFYIVQIICFILLFMAYLLLSIKKYDYAAVLILLMFFIIIISWVRKSITYIKHSKNQLGLVITYLYSSATIISLFLAINVVLTNDQNYIKNEHGTIMNDTFSKAYYSIETYYTSNPGDTIPVGKWMKITSQIEVIFSVILHTFIIGEALNLISNSNKKKSTIKR